jgi:hypothetical protein
LHIATLLLCHPHKLEAREIQSPIATLSSRTPLKELLLPFVFCSHREKTKSQCGNIGYTHYDVFHIFLVLNLAKKTVFVDFIQEKLQQ